jgi:NAD-dependent SIR2 family protein deacetylase
MKLQQPQQLHGNFKIEKCNACRAQLTVPDMEVQEMIETMSCNGSSQEQA